MIQRIQSLFLAIAALFGALLLICPIYSLIPGETTFDTAIYTFKLSGIMSAKGAVQVLLYQPSSLIFIVAAIIALLFVAIFSFKNRKRQMLICKSVNFLILAFIAFLLSETRNLRHVVGPGHALHFDLAAILPLLMVVLVVLAHRAIRKDDELVRSADRLR
jgi:hypothetical protein